MKMLKNIRMVLGERSPRGGFFRAFMIAMSMPSSTLAETDLIPHCFSQSSESCEIVIEGPIEDGLTERLRTLIDRDGARGSKISLNSPGGSLGEGILLGRYIREIGYETTIAGTRGLPRLPNGEFDFPDRDAIFKNGICESACAYAFLGGTIRSFGIGSRLGLHRFSAEHGSIGDDRAQALAGQLLSYLIEMDVDPRLFVVASATDAEDMYYVSEEEALKFDVVTPTTLSRFFMEPYRNGVISAVRKQQRSDQLDRVTQISAFCRSGRPYLLFFAPEHALSQVGEVGMRFNSMSYYNVFSRESIAVRIAPAGAYLTIEINQQAKHALLTDDRIRMSFLYVRDEVGYYGALLKLNDMDRAMLRSSFTHCIE